VQNRADHSKQHCRNLNVNVFNKLLERLKAGVAGLTSGSVSDQMKSQLGQTQDSAHVATQRMHPPPCSASTCQVL